MGDTKIIYHIDDEETPYLVKLSVLPSAVTLGDFKNALNRPNYKFFFKSLDADFGVVKEEITEDDAHLPCFNGKVISWLVSADSSTKSDSHSNGAADGHGSSHLSAQKNTNSVSKNSDTNAASNNKVVEPPSEQEHAVGTTGHNLEECDTCAESDSVYSGDRVPPLRNFHAYKHGSRLAKFGQRVQNYETSSSMMSSDLESTSFFDSEDESSRFSTATGTTVSSKYGHHRKQRRHRRLFPVRRVSEDASSFSSMTDSTMSLNVINVTLNMDTVKFLGISIVGQSNKAGDGGIYVGSIMRGGAVAQDGRIEPGDMILEVNRISFEDMSNDEAVRVLREEVQKPGPITLVVAKCWDPSPKNYFTVPRQEPVRPIDPRAWVLHTNAMTGAMNNLPVGGAPPYTGPGSPHTGMSMVQGGYIGVGPNPGIPLPGVPPGMSQLLPPSLATLTSLPSSSNITSKSLPEVAEGNDSQANEVRGYRSSGPGSSGGGGAGGPGSAKAPGSRSGDDAKTGASLLGTNAKSASSLTVATDMASVVHSMLLPDSGLEIRDRIWLKITIPNAFIGSDLVDWLYSHVDGFADRRDARRYATELLKYGYIRHTVNKNTFSEQCYYVFGDIANALSHLTFDDVDSVSEVGGPSAQHGQSHALISQRYPPIHHGLSETGSSGLTVLPNSNIPAGSVFGVLGPPPMSAQHTGDANSLSQNGPHYPYSSVIYPVGNAVSSSVSPPCVVDGTSGAAGVVSSTGPIQNRQGQMVLASIQNNLMDGTNASQQPMVFPQQGMEAQNFANAGPVITGIQRNPVPGQIQQRLVSHHVGNSSSSCSSRSSGSSASSSSSTASSGTRLGPSATNGVNSSNSNGSNSRKTIHDLNNNANAIPLAHPVQSRNGPSSVQSASGASSGSSTSRQNGTGASGTGSGSGSGATGRISSRPPISTHLGKSDPMESVVQTSACGDMKSQMSGSNRMSKTSSITELSSRLAPRSSAPPSSGISSTLTSTSGPNKGQY
ncbi:unnamed protein product [Calicophoron daubneyi]|uniref:Dishevelled n=1 Tax=Calicophoron daubneyi TaxID=300641 RepID=A0AAV2TKP5_CALDB